MTHGERADLAARPAFPPEALREEEPMPRLVPSQVVAYMDRAFPWATGDSLSNDLLAMQFPSTRNSSIQLATLLALVEEISPELFTLESGDYAQFREAVVVLAATLEGWQAGQGDQIHTVDGIHPISIVRQALGRCPDAVPAPATTELAFITDAALRDSIRLDLSAANADLVAGQWKAATVLAGAALEALLLWALQEKEVRSPGAAATRASQLVPKTLDKPPPSALDDWTLHPLVEVTAALGLITSSAADQARLAKTFRNLIHPGRANRKAQVCDRGTALAAIAGVEFVARDLGACSRLPLSRP